MTSPKIELRQPERPVDVVITGPRYEAPDECTAILRELPEWFGIEESILQYSAEIERNPTFLALSSEKVLGFISLKLHNPFSAEILVMGIRPEFHRQGIGQSLIKGAEDWLRKQEVEYLQVKTLGPTNHDPNYANTRKFYMAMGFRPLEELPQIWDEHNPCLILVKRL